jgi:hypothetical protein
MGYYLLFEFDKHMARKEMKAQIRANRSAFTVLKIGGREGDRTFRRIDRNEIEYKGRLYDVVREIKSGDDRIFVCLHDTREEGLYSGLKNVQGHKPHLAVWDHLVKITFPDLLSRVCLSSPTTLIYPHISEHISSSFLPTWSPPPETVTG